MTSLSLSTMTYGYARALILVLRRRRRGRPIRRPTRRTNLKKVKMSQQHVLEYLRPLFRFVDAFLMRGENVRARGAEFMPKIWIFHPFFGKTPAHVPCLLHS